MQGHDNVNNIVTVYQVQDIHNVHVYHKSAATKFNYMYMIVLIILKMWLGLKKLMLCFHFHC